MAALDLAAFPVTFSELPAVLTVDAALAAAAPQLHSQRPGNLLVSGQVVRGDVAAALAGSAVTVEASFESGFVEHAYIEPEAGYAVRHGDRITVAACTQSPHLDRDDTANILGIRPDQVRIIPTAVGGGFGAKLDLSVQPFLAVAAWQLGRPVRMVYSRGELMMSTTKRHPGRITMQAGATADGHITGCRFRRRLQYRRLRFVGPDRRQSGASACLRPLLRAALPGARAGDPHPLRRRRRVSRIWRATGGDRPGADLRRTRRRAATWIGWNSASSMRWRLINRR